jgi:UDP-N-acetylmuramyl pentapeptide phosphotransferase/UDP-N-acetylglucosamine-1-phosphate transferase
MAGLLVANVSGWTGGTFWKAEEPARAEEWLWIMGLTLMVATVSFWDDRRALPPSIRLGLHGLASAGAVWGAGLVVEVVPVPFVGDIALGALAAPLTLLGLMWMTNLYNFMDGMDGFAAGMTVLGFGMLGYLVWRGGAQQLALVSLLIAVAAGGFLLFNLPPARIFMGDIGSVPLGFLAGTLSASGVRDGIFDLWVPLLIFSPFIVDATVTLFRRLLRGVKVWHAHREHYYQRLVLTGWGHRKTMVAEYGLMLATGATAVLYVHGTEPVRLGLLSLWAIGYIVLARGVRAVELKAGKHGTGA